MDYIIVIGLVAGFLTTVSFLPQVIKTWKTKSTKDISFYMFSILTVGIFLWMIYGFLINSLPVILANAVSLILSAIIMAFKIKYK